jgi:hypothetical protein
MNSLEDLIEIADEMGKPVIHNKEKCLIEKRSKILRTTKEEICISLK